MRTTSHSRGSRDDVVCVVALLCFRRIYPSGHRQMWTAFGIMFGNVMDLAFYHVPDKHNIKGLNWRLMLASVRVR